MLADLTLDLEVCSRYSGSTANDVLITIMMKCVVVVVRLMALVVYCLTVDTALLSVVVSGAASGPSPATRELHLPSQDPTFSPKTPAAADSTSNRSEILTSLNETTATEVDGNSTTPGTSGTAKDIWLIGLFPLQGSWAGGLGQLPAVQMGLEDVNADPNILPGYRLRMTMDDTAVSGSNNNTNVLIIIIIDIETEDSWNRPLNWFFTGRAW